MAKTTQKKYEFSEKEGKFLFQCKAAGCEKQQPSGFCLGFQARCPLFLAVWLTAPSLANTWEQAKNPYLQTRKYINSVGLRVSWLPAGKKISFASIYKFISTFLDSTFVLWLLLCTDNDKFSVTSLSLRKQALSCVHLIPICRRVISLFRACCKLPSNTQGRRREIRKKLPPKASGALSNREGAEPAWHARRKAVQRVYADSTVGPQPWEDPQPAWLPPPEERAGYTCVGPALLRKRQSQPPGAGPGHLLPTRAARSWEKHLPPPQRRVLRPSKLLGGAAEPQAASASRPAPLWAPSGVT